MAQQLAISAKIRKEIGKTANKIRKTGLVPSVLYGRKTKSMSLSVDAKEFAELFSKSGESTLVKLQVENEPKPRTVLIHDVQRHILTDEPAHVDFYEVDMTQKIKTGIPLTFVGESKAVKDLGGILVKNITELEVESLPGDLPHNIEVDISKLNSFDDSITVSALPVDLEKVKVLAQPEEVVAKVMPPRSEEELKELEEKPVAEEVSAVEGVEKVEKKEGEEGAESGKEEKNKAE